MTGPPSAFYNYRHSITIDVDFCVGCFRCIGICQGTNGDVIGRALINGKKKAYAKHPEHCVGCMRCLRTCQSSAIAVVTNHK